MIELLEINIKNYQIRLKTKNIYNYKLFYKVLYLDSSSVAVPYNLFDNSEGPEHLLFVRYFVFIKLTL